MAIAIQSPVSFNGTAKLRKIINKLAERFSEARRDRKAFKELNNLTNRELNDIGISRGDIRAIVYQKESFYKDSKRTAPAEANTNIKGWV